MENSLKRALSLFLAYPFFVMAHVEEPQVTAGSATFEKPDANTQLIHAADKTAINCKAFNVKKGETVHFKQTNPKDRVLCRVTGKEASWIEGHLEADGRLFLINPSSIFFRETAQVNVHSLIVSTLNIKDEDFIKGNYRFFLDNDAKDSKVVNKGQIKAAQDVAFMAPQIVNRAIVKAVAGKVAFLGGELITLNFEGDNLISFAIDGPLKNGFIEQAGQIEAGQGVLLKLRVADEMIKSVVNVSGIEPATSMQFDNGKIYLVAGSSIASSNIKVEAPLVETAGDFKGSTKIEIKADKELKWQGGYIQGGYIEKKLVPTDVALNAPEGMLVIDAPIGKNKDEKVKTLSINGKIIDQNAPIKTYGSMAYSAGMTFISADTYAFNSNITFNSPVVVDGDKVKITSGRSSGDIVFNETLDADQPSRSLTIFNGSSTVSFKKPIGSKGPFSNLSIETGKLSLGNVGDRNNIGAGNLNIKAKTVDFLGTVVNAKEQTWGDSDSRDPISIHLKSGQPLLFITHEKPLIFSPTTQVLLSSQTSVAFETHGGNFELSKLSGDHQQSITINTGHGDAKIGEFEGKLGLLHVQSQNIRLNGKIDVGSAFMEAQEYICYAVNPRVETIPRELISEGDVTLNAKRGMIGTKELPIHVESKGKLYVGSKSYAYVKGKCEDGFPSVYSKNPPPRIVFNDNEIQYVFNEEIFMEEEELMSLTPDLYHTIPHGFVDAKHFTSRRAPIYYVK